MNDRIVCSCEGLSKSYGRVEVLDNCFIEIAGGELVGLIGENGSGKSTFVRCLLGYTKPSAGTVTISGSVGYCPQDNILNQSYTLLEHLALASDIYGRRMPVDMDYVDRLIDRFRLGDFKDRTIGKLSSGTRQKVQFITSILHRPGLLIMDEPYDGFDWEMYLTFWDVIAELKEIGTGILLISHLVYDRENFDRILTLDRGKVRED